MDKNDISIATITWARDEGEEKLLREFLQKLSELQVPVFITDGGSRPGFLDFIKSLPHFNVSDTKERGVWAQTRNSLLEADKRNSKFIFYTEPDKSSFFSQLQEIIHKITVDELSGILMVSRSEAGFKTFPAFQQMTETAINNCCSEVIGKNFDYTYGPFLLNSGLVAEVTKVTEDIGWGWRPLAFALAARLGYRVEALKDHFFCPPDQQQDNEKERLYRIKQLHQNIEGLLLSQSLVLHQ